MNNFKKLILIGFFVVLNCEDTFAKNSVIINEIHPNPKGKDQGREWLELYNDSNQTIFLDEYQVESSQESKNLENSKIEAREFKVINIKLKNSDEKVTLSHNGETISKITYEKAPEALSLSLNEKREYIWTSVSKKLPNPRETILNGKIKTMNENLILLKTNNQNLKINSKKKLNLQLLNFLEKSRNATLKVEESFNSSGVLEYSLKSINIKNQKPKKSKKPKESLLELFSLYSILTLLLAKLSLPYGLRQ